MTNRLLTLCIASITLVASSAHAQEITGLKKKKARLSCIEMSTLGSKFRENSIIQPWGVRGTPLPASLGAVWTLHDGGQAWIGGAVSIGMHGTQVFTESDVNNQTTQIFSVFDAHPPTPTMTVPVPESESHSLVSAETTDTHVALSHTPAAGSPGELVATLRKYRGMWGFPSWSYSFDDVAVLTSRLGISRDGETIVAALTDANTGELHVSVFDPVSGTPTASAVLPVGMGNYLRGFDLSADGSTLFLAADFEVLVVDVATLDVVFTSTVQASFDSYAISGDGSLIAIGGFDSVEILEWTGTTYAQLHAYHPGGQVHSAFIDLSDDGSTLAMGWNHHDAFQAVTLEALDVTTGAITMSETLVGSGGQNLVSDVVISADGSRFAAGLWGDQGGLVDELRLYASDQDAPLATLDTRGSVFDIDLSADGRRVVAASKSMHSNRWGSGGSVDLLFVDG